MNIDRHQPAALQATQLGIAHELGSIRLFVIAVLAADITITMTWTWTALASTLWPARLVVVLALPVCLLITIRLTLRWSRRRGHDLVKRFGKITRDDARYAAMIAELRKFLQDGDAVDVDIVFSRARVTNAATVDLGVRHAETKDRVSASLVELPLGLMKPYRAATTGDGQPSFHPPPALSAVLAHEAGHVYFQDPQRGFKILATAFASLSTTALALVAYKALRIFGFVAMVALPLHVLFGTCSVVLAWFALVIGNEIQADVYATSKVGLESLRDLYAFQLDARASKKSRSSTTLDLDSNDSLAGVMSRVQGVIVRFLLHPDLAWRITIPGTDGQLGWFSTVLLATAYHVGGYSIEIMGLSFCHMVSTDLGVFSALTSRLVCWFVAVWLQYKIFWHQNIRPRLLTPAASVLRSVGQAIVFALCAALVASLYHLIKPLPFERYSLRDQPLVFLIIVPIVVPFCLSLVTWAAANVGIVLARSVTVTERNVGVALIAYVVVILAVVIPTAIVSNGFKVMARYGLLNNIFNGLGVRIDAGAHMVTVTSLVVVPLLLLVATGAIAHRSAFRDGQSTRLAMKGGRT